MTNKLKFTSQGSGIPLVLIHGWGMNSSVWQPIKAKLLEHYQVITVDLPGFGENIDVQLTDYSLTNIANLIVDSVDIPAIYLGWSLGGLIASEIALTMPEQVYALVTVASSPCFISDEDWPAINAEVLKSFHQQLAQSPTKTIKGFLKIQAMGSPTVRQDIKQVSDLVLQFPEPEKKLLDRSLSLLETSDQRHLLSNINQPFLRLYGRLDGLVPRQAINLIDNLAPQSQSYIFQKSSHAPFISEPGAFVDYLNQWILLQTLPISTTST